MVAGLACLALAAATLLFVFYIRPDPTDLAPHRSRIDHLLERRDAIYENLRDLKFEFRGGKLSEVDYNETREALEREAAFVLGQIEQLTGSAPSIAARQAKISKPRA
jgi:hypothetical protein